MKDLNIEKKTDQDLHLDLDSNLKNKIIYGETRSYHQLHFEESRGLIHPPFDEGVLADQYRHLKRCLLTSSRLPFILMTSTVHGEGKTTASINLAMSLSLEQDWQVCLIDCSGNMNNCMTKLKVNYQKGLMDYLEKEHQSISEFIIPTNYDNVKLLPYGKQSARRHELIASKKMQALLNQLLEKYENTIFILDAPELELSETKLLSNMVSSVVLVLEQSKTPITKVKECLKLIDKAKVAGVLFNKASVFSLTD